MNSTILPLSVLFLITIIASCATANDPDQEEWIDLFNGENFEGWDIKIAGYELNENVYNTFRVEDGLLKVRYNEYDRFNGEFGHIFFNTPYSHYRLKVEYRFYGEQTEGGPGWAFMNNGIMFHSQSAGSMDLDQDFPVSIEFQLLGSDGTGERPNGSICTPGTQVVVDGVLRTEHCISSGGPTHPGYEWVTAELVALGDSLLIHKLNGETVMEYSATQLADGTPLSGGYIALQAESHPTTFRSVRLLNLKGCMDPDAVNYKSYYVEHEMNSCEYP
ncbi:MAG: DUF1080 domain-containing protein [Balneolaceae bacterium]|nr:MAG: DUF1080 domain-containing protein [Balneolaceae bacterium]